jgi:hypothetical protein
VLVKKDHCFTEFLQCELSYECATDPQHPFRMALVVCIEEHGVTSAPTATPTTAPTSEPTFDPSFPISDRVGLHVIRDAQFYLEDRAYVWCPLAIRS